MAILVLNPDTVDAHFIQLDRPSMLLGRATNADIQLDDDSISDQHARIECKPDGYYAINLQTQSPLLINEVSVTFQRLKHGDRLTFGDVTGTFMLEDSDSAAVAPIHEVATRPESPPFRTNAHAPVQIKQVRCPRCGVQVLPNQPSCPQCGLPFSNLPTVPSDFIPPTPMSQVGPGILPIIAFLAALTVVGAPIALVLGLMTLSIIRKRGGTIRDHTLAKWSIGLGLVWLMLGAGVAVGLVQKMQQRAQLNTAEAYESQVIRALKNLACAQKYAHTIEYRDTDADGYGEYGDLQILAETKSPFFDPDLSDGEAFGYWFSIREASEGQFLAVAEPTHYGETGIRTFVIDPSGQIRGGDTQGQRFGQVESVLPFLQGERSAYYEIDDEIAKDVLNYVKSLSSDLIDQEKTQRILRRLRKEYALTTVGRELDGMESSVDRFVTEQHAQAIYLAAQSALAEGKQDVALAKLMEIQEEHPSFSGIAAVEREWNNLRSEIAQLREQQAQDLFAQAEEIERQGQQPQEVQRLYQRIEKLYPDTDVATRIASLKPELQRQLREHSAENIFSDLMELSPEQDYEEILNRANQLRRNYKNTHLFGKVQSELGEKERKARASSWRVKTQQNMEAGHMRGALAQLESAARENPDLLYDLRDLCITLYRSVADTLMNEGDARKALKYYEMLSQLLQTASPGEQVSSELLAKLHNDVGQADYGLKKYKEARWHFASAAWKYQQDAQFNARFGAANLYTGLYQPAEAALTQALEIQENMSSALLYRAYMNLRVALTQERILASRFQDDRPEVVASEKEEADDSDQMLNNLILSIDDSTDSDDEITVSANMAASGSSTVTAPKSLNVKSTGLRETWFSRFTEIDLNAGSSVPEPTDIDLFLNFNYYVSSDIVLGFMQFLEELELQKIETAAAESYNKFQANSQDSGRNAMRRMGRSQTKASEQRNLTEFHSQLRQLRTLHLEDIESRQELAELMNDMKQRILDAIADIQSAGSYEARIQSLTASTLKKLNEKYDSFDKAKRLIATAMKEELTMRKRMLTLTEKMLLDESSSSYEREISRFRNKLFKEDSSTVINPALRALRDAMDVRVDLTDILRTAEGNTQAGGAQMVDLPE